MKNIVFRKMVVICVMLLLSGTFFISGISANKSDISSPVIVTVNQLDGNINIIYDINNFDEIPVRINNIEYSKIFIGEESNLLLKGMPDIPSVCRSILIPDTAKMEVRVIDATFQVFDNMLIAPSKGNLPRSVNPDNVPYEFDDFYNTDIWFPQEIVSLRDPYILRDFRGQVVEIYPIQYNPVRKQMRFYTNIKVEVVPVGIDHVNCLYRDRLPDCVDSEFKLTYENHFVNFGKSGRYDPVPEQGNMLIICYDDFMDEMQTFVEWKIKKGIPTEIVKVSEIGNANAIKTYISDYYDNNGLTFVLLVGDAAQVPTLYASGSASDPSYTFVAGNDHYPDLFVGRFSAQNADQVNTQVERSLEYEFDPLADGEWYHKGTGVASNQGPGDDGEYDNQHIDNIRAKLLAYTYTEVDQIYDPSATAQMVVNALNDGRSIVNYCGHGSPYGWGSSGFSVSNINSLVNDNMLPYVTCVACNNGQFDDYDACFCEAWLRATNNGEPAGGIIATGSSKSMSWNPPMDAQDEFIDLIVESYQDNIKHTFGGIHYNGVMHMNDEYGYAGYSETDTWHVFGDPSLTIRTDTPEEMVVIHNEEIDEESTYYEVFVSGIENALCAISRNGELLGYAYTDESGNAIIEFDDPIMGEEPLDLVITAYNKIPYIDEIIVITNEPPEIPEKPTGPTSGKTGVLLTYSTRTTDPDGNDIFYMWDWGDGNQSIWMGPYSSGETAYASWIYEQKGSFEIKVKAKDTEDDETDWSEPLLISITKSKVNSVFLNILGRLQMGL